MRFVYVVDIKQISSSTSLCSFAHIQMQFKTLVSNLFKGGGEMIENILPWNQRFISKDPQNPSPWQQSPHSIRKLHTEPFPPGDTASIKNGSGPTFSKQVNYH